MNRPNSQISELSRWSTEAMAEAASLAAARKSKGRPGPTHSDLVWAGAVLQAVGLPGLPLPEVYLESGSDTRRVEVIWPDPRVQVFLSPLFGWAWWPTRFAAARLRRVLLRHYPEAGSWT